MSSDESARPHIVSLGLIPVQEWIGEARRSRDLRAGSLILSHVMARVLHRLGQDLGATIAVPVERGTPFQELAASFHACLGEPYGIPNRATAFCTVEDPAVLIDCLEALEPEKVVRTWQCLKAEHLQPFLCRHLLGSEGDREARNAVRHYLETTANGEDCPFSLVWVALPWSGRPEDRPEALEEIDRAYRNIKRTRPVRPWRHGARVGKCNQCGRREAIGPTEDFNRWRRWHERLGELDAVQKGKVLSEGERLCYVCLTKRRAGYATRDGESFPSTGEVATAPWREALEAAGLGTALAEIRKTALGRDDFGRALLLSDEALQAEGDAGLIAAHRRLRVAIEAWNRDLPEDTAPLPVEPSRYLAMLVFDGDDMGRRVREDLEGMARKMGDFAAKAREVLDEAVPGRPAVFYLGGDEGLAMVPASAAPKAARGIRRAFGEVFGLEEGAPTLSLGMVFFEATRPLGGAIRAAHLALQRAKDVKSDGKAKDALGVTVETASGSRWGWQERWGAAWDRTVAAVDLVQEGTLASGWAYDVELFLRSQEPDAGAKPGVAEASLAEVRRLFFRRIFAGAADEGREGAESGADRKRTAWSRLEGADGWDDGRPELDPDQFHLIGFLARQTAPAPSATTPPAEG